MADRSLVKIDERQNSIGNRILGSGHESQRRGRSGGALGSGFGPVRLAPPLWTVGNDPQGLKDWFATWRDQIGFAITELNVTAGDDVAFCYALIHLTGSRTDGSHSDVWFRETLGLRKVGDVWKIAHGHESVPMHMDGSFKAAIDLKP